MDRAPEAPEDFAMRFVIPGAAALLGLAAFCPPASAQATLVEVSGAWARATTSSAKVGGVFLTLKASGTPDRVVSVSSPMAEKVELHETISEGGVMKMREVPQLVVSPAAPTVLRPGGYHMMLLGLKKPLNRGETFPLTVTFEKSPPVTATVTVQAAGAAGPAHGH
jgi:copper(I)-binding protein